MSGLYEAEAFAALQVVAAHTTAMTNAMTAAANALGATERDDVAKQLEKVTELHRLVSARLAGILRRMGEG